MPPLTPVLERDGCVLFLDAVTVLPEDVESAFRWLDTWEAVVPLRPHTQLAQDFGTDDERAITRQIVLDLRQPVYDHRVIAARSGLRLDALLAAWRQEELYCVCDELCPLAFLRAVWRVKPLLLAAPSIWVQEEVAT